MESLLQFGGGGAILGYVFQFITTLRNDNNNRIKTLLEIQKGNDKSNAQYFNQAQTENKTASLIRSVLTFSIIGLFIFLVIAGIFVETNIIVVNEGFTFLGFQITGDTTSWVKKQGLIAYPTILNGMSAFIGYYFGKEAAK